MNMAPIQVEMKHNYEDMCVSMELQITPECAMQCRSFKQGENLWSVTIWVLVVMLQTSTEGHAALVNEDTHARLAFPQT